MATTVGSAAHGAGTLREAKCLPDSRRRTPMRPTSSTSTTRTVH